jgi:hypothetical protein
MWRDDGCKRRCGNRPLHLQSAHLDRSRPGAVRGSIRDYSVCIKGSSVEGGVGDCCDCGECTEYVVLESGIGGGGWRLEGNEMDGEGRERVCVREVVYSSCGC